MEADGEGVGRFPDSDLEWVWGETAAFTEAKGVTERRPSRSGKGLSPLGVSSAVPGAQVEVSRPSIARAAVVSKETGGRACVSSLVTSKIPESFWGESQTELEMKPLPERASELLEEDWLKWKSKEGPRQSRRSRLWLLQRGCQLLDEQGTQTSRKVVAEEESLVHANLLRRLGTDCLGNDHI